MSSRPRPSALTSSDVQNGGGGGGGDGNSDGGDGGGGDQVCVSKCIHVCIPVRRLV